MARTPTPVEEALLDALEPEAKAAWIDDVLTMAQAIAASQAITDRRAASAVADQVTVSIRSLPPEVQDTLPPAVRDTYDPDFDTETP